MTRWIEQLLHLRHGDLGRGALLFSYLFLIIASYIVGKAARNALFLGQFGAVKLPYAMIAIAVLAGFVIAAYVRIGQYVGLRNLLVGSLLFFAANVVVFWWLAQFHRLPWLFPVFYVWTGIFGVLAPAQVWTLANYVLTTRDAKRMFGLVGSGGISGAIFGGFFTKTFAGAYGTESLLLGMAVLLVACSVLVVFIWRQKQTNLGDIIETQEVSTQEGPKNLQESLNQVWASPYFRAIAAVICLSSIVTTVAGWQFLAIAQQTLVEKNALAVFFGNFDFYAGIAGLAFQLVLTARVLRRFGIGPALFVVPMALMFSSLGLLIWSTLVAAIILKASDQVLSKSIDRSSVELLYLPVPANVKMQVKSFIDTVIWRLGDGLGGVALAVFADRLGWTPPQMTWLNLVFIFGWFNAAFVARQQYVSRLRESIRQHRLDAERALAPVLDRSTTLILASKLNAVDPKEILYGLSLFQMEYRQAAHPAVRGLLDHPSAEVRQRAISLLNAAGDKTVLGQAENLLRDPDLAVRTEALLYLSHHARIDPLERIQQLGDFADFSIRSAMVAFLAQPGDTQNLEAARMMLDAMVQEKGTEGRRTRLEAARLVGSLPHYFEEQLRQLLHDPDPDVASHAIHAVGNLRIRHFVPLVLDRMRHPQLAPAAAECLGKFGDRIVGTLRDHLCDPAIPIEVRREIPGVLVQIGTIEAERALVENLLEGDTMLRFRVIASLNKLHQAHPELEVDTQMIETVLAAEIMGHYRSYQIVGTLGGHLDSEDPAVRALRESMNQEVERIFRLLGLLFPNYDLHSAYFGVQSENAVVHDNALEFLDNTLKPQLRNLLVPLLDSQVSVAERCRLANRLLGTRVESREEAVATLMYSDDPWLKACAAYAIGALGLKSLEPELDNWVNDPDPLLRETVRQAKLRLAALSAAAGHD